MAETIDRDDIPQATVIPPRRRRISVVWVIPIFAAVVGIGIAIQRIISEGPTITILFKSAGGVEAGKTFIKYKDVNIGQVTEVHLASDYSKVEVTARIAKSAAGLIVEDAKFWVVEPRVTLSGVSGLGTLLSGNYIGFEPGKSTKQQRSFTGIEVPPIVTSGEPGREFVLTSDNLGSVGVGSPVYYRRLQVGQVVAYKMADDGNSVTIKVFVNAPYDKFVNAGTRFWNASGIDASIGAGGVEIRTQSIVAILAGGLAFDTPPFAPKVQPAAAADAVFVLYNDQATAMKQPDAQAVHYVLYFNESLRGLSVGAPVTLLGLQVGAVTEIGIDINPKTMNIRGRVEVVAYPERLAARLDETQASLGKIIQESAKNRHALLRALVEQHGLRAQLRSGSLVTGQLFVALDYFPNAPKVKMDWSREPTELPIVASTITDIEAKVTAIVAKLDKVPLEAIGADISKALVTLDQMLQGADKAVNRIDAEVTPELKTTIEGIRTTLVSADGVLKNADATLVGKDAPAQQDLRDALQEVTRASRSLRVLSDYLERHPESLIRGKTEEKP
ncbi:MAG TPA: MlaD family protein [Candidatus Binatia bacterium]|nr:MlaD family protein [Candidatus Binatia bacterium]